MILKRLFRLLLFFICLFPVLPAGGVLAESSSPLHVIRTEYFDIIFPEECRESAEKIEAVCDDYYIEITSILETEAYQRFPVTITRSVEVLNAYYAAVPYNRIVLYDTMPETSLDMYEDTLQSVFYHELTHAVTYNMKAGILKKLSFIADALNPAWLSITTFWAEGATVSFESKGRGGRLNDPFTTQLVNQSKIEGNFPGWRDVTGARDTFPGGRDAYIFGAMFASWLQETYGMSKYADFWKKAGSSLTFSFVAGVFKKTYGFNIGDAWDEFEKTLDLEAREKIAEVFSHKKSQVSTFDVYFCGNGERKIAYFDSVSASLRLLTLDSDGKIKKNKKLLAITGISRVQFSPDGESLALIRYIDKKNYKFVSAEYSIKKGKYTQFPQTGIRSSYYMMSNGKAELVEINRNPLDDEKFAAQNEKILKKTELAFSPLGIDENLSAMIVKDGLKWTIRFFDSEKPLFEYDFSELSAGDSSDSENPLPQKQNLIVHELHLVRADENSIFLSFTWAELGKGGKMLSRAGFLKIDRKSLSATTFLQKENFFAGFIAAVPDLDAATLLDSESDLETEAEKSFPVYIIAAEYDKNPLYRIEMKACDFESAGLNASLMEGFNDAEKSSDENAVAEVLPENSSEDAEGAGAEESVPSHQEISYNPFRYYRKGVFLPVLAQVPIYSHDFDADATALLGFTFISTNPWGDRQVNFSAGYNSSYKDGGMSLSFSGGNDSFQYSLAGNCIFDKKGFMQNEDSLTLTKYLWRGKVSSFASGFQGQFLYGRQIIDDDFDEKRDDTVGKSADALTFLQFSNIHKISPHVFNLAGFSFQPFLLGSFRDSEKLLKHDKYLNAGAKAVVRFPIIVPFIFTATLFPSSKYAASGSVKAILASFEINKGIPAVSLFMQRLVLSASYSGKLSYVHGELWDIKKSEEIFRNSKKSDYSDDIQMRADMYFSPNTGYLANGDIQFSLGYVILYRPNPKKTEKRVSYGLSAAFNY